MHTNHNRILALALAIALTLSLTACGGQPAPQSSTPQGSSSQGNSSLGTSSTQGETSSQGPFKGPAAPTDTTLSATQYQQCIQVGNTVLSLENPLHLADFLSAGAILTDANLSEGYLMDGKAEKIVSFLIGTTTLQVYFTNYTDTRISLGECEATRIYGTTKGPDVIYAGGISVGDSLSDLTTAWGEPTEDRSKSSGQELTYLYMENPANRESLTDTTVMSSVPTLMSTTGNSYTVIIDRNTSAIKNIQMLWNVGTDERIHANSTVISFGQNKYNLSWEMPFTLWRNNLGGSQFVGLMTIENVPCVVTLDANFFSMGALKSHSEADIDERLNLTGNSVPYTIQLTPTEGEETRAVGTAEENGALRVALGYFKGEHSHVSFGSKIFPLKEGDTLSEAAKAEFLTLATDFLTSVEQAPIQ